jgi:hypothetical protein
MMPEGVEQSTEKIEILNTLILTRRQGGRKLGEKFGRRLFEPPRAITDRPYNTEAGCTCPAVGDRRYNGMARLRHVGV